MVPRRLALFLAVVVPLCGCDIGNDPYLRGVITSRAPKTLGKVGGGVDSIPAMFVDGTGIWPAPRPCSAMATLWIGSRTQVWRHGMPSDTAQLKVGRRVTVYITGFEETSCPPSAAAARVDIED